MKAAEVALGHRREACSTVWRLLPEFDLGPLGVTHLQVLLTEELLPNIARTRATSIRVSRNDGEEVYRASFTHKGWDGALASGRGGPSTRDRRAAWAPAKAVVARSVVEWIVWFGRAQGGRWEADASLVLEAPLGNVFFTGAWREAAPLISAQLTEAHEVLVGLSGGIDKRTGEHAWVKWSSLIERDEDTGDVFLDLSE